MTSISPDRLKRIIGWMATSVSIAVAIAIPLGYFLTAYHYETKRLQAKADLDAHVLSEYAYTHPDTWRFHEHRLIALTQQASTGAEPLRQRLSTEKGEQLFVIGPSLPAPLLSRLSDVVDGQQPIARIEVTGSLRPVLLRTALAATIALVLALSVYLVLRVLPMRALRHALEELDQSQQALEFEIKARELALHRAEEIGEEMRHQALHDHLTGLPNRAMFQNRLQAEIRVPRRPGYVLAVLMLDLDRFKEINDTLGHHVGDTLLREVGSRLRAVLRHNDIVARLGGDEFAIILSEVEPQHADAIARKVQDALEPPFHLHHYNLSVKASIGITLFPVHGDSANLLMQRADVAMYQAKRAGTGIALYDPARDEQNRGHLKLLSDLRSALDKDQLFLSYQPKIGLQGRHVIGVEALLRWRHPEAGLIMPSEFISVAEQTGMITPLTMWVVEHGLRQAAAWQQAGAPLSIAVNLSPRDLHDERLPGRFRDLLERWRVPPEQLVLEITENAMMADPAGAMQVLVKLADTGIRLAIDDFGTGYSSLAYLKKLPVQELKIDRSFVTDLRNDRDDLVIVRSTIDLAHNLGLSVVAEGVEDRETYELLLDLGCDAAQGYYMCKPVPVPEFDQWRAASPWGMAAAQRA